MGQDFSSMEQTSRNQNDSYDREMSDIDSCAMCLTHVEAPVSTGSLTARQSDLVEARHESSCNHDLHSRNEHRRTGQHKGPTRTDKTSTSPARIAAFPTNLRRSDIMAVTSILNDTSNNREDEYRVLPGGQRSIKLPFRERAGTASANRSYGSLTQGRSSTAGLPPCMPGSVSDRREARPSYDLEEEAFIWYHKDDLDMDWDTVTDLYQRQRFPHSRDKTGLQCKYYRFRKEHGAAEVRDVRASPRIRQQDPVPYGIIFLTNIRYP